MSSNTLYKHELQSCKTWNHMWRHNLSLLRSKYASHWNNTTWIEEDIGIWFQSTSSNLKEEQRIQAREHHSNCEKWRKQWNNMELFFITGQSYITEKRMNKVMYRDILSKNLFISVRILKWISVRCFRTQILNILSIVENFSYILNMNPLYSVILRQILISVGK